MLGAGSQGSQASQRDGSPAFITLEEITLHPKGFSR